MRIAVIQFPASNCDLDALHALRLLGLDADLVWHRDFNGKGGDYDGAILPGGFSYGDHLRAGAIAAFTPAVQEVKDMAREGKPVGGICNGFQILMEAGLLPGALIENSSMKFICRWVIIKTETKRTAFTTLMSVDQLLRMPVAHHQGRFFIDEPDLKSLYENDQIVFRYVDDRGAPTEDSNPNGSLQNIAGVCNLEGNVVGLMPHPERASEAILNPGSSKTSDGRIFFESMIDYIRGRT